MTALTWRSGGPQHRQALSGFVCADPERKLYDKHRGKWHPRIWEHEVQSALRGLGLPVSRGEAAALGFDGHGLAAVAHFGYERHGLTFMIWGIASALRCRRQGLGEEALEIALASMRATNQHSGRNLPVYTRVDPRNEASTGMVKKAGFEFLRHDHGYDGYIRSV